MISPISLGRSAECLARLQGHQPDRDLVGHEASDPRHLEERPRRGDREHDVGRRPAGVRGYPVYSASKWGVVGVTKVAAREFASQGIRVNAIAPGSIDTPLFSNVVNSTPTSRADYEKPTPMGRIAKSEEVAAAAVIPVDGGMTL